MEKKFLSPTSFIKKFLFIFTAAVFLVGSLFVSTGTALASDAVLGVTQISAVQTFATADGTFANGWKWTFDVTVPTNETILKMKFADWTNGSNSIPAGSNIQFYSAQSTNASDESHAITIDSAGIYSGAMNVNPNEDLDVSKAGRQIQVTVEARVPVGSAGGSYSTSYGINSAIATETLTFDSAGGSAVAPITQDFGTSVTAPAAPTKEGYTFVDWSPVVPTTMPLSETLTATWNVNSYNFILMDGATQLSSTPYDFGTSVATPATPTKTGYTFTGWDATVPTTMPANDVTLNATWTPISETLTFDSAGGSDVASITQDYGSDVTAPTAPTKVGYTFVDWSPVVPTTMPLSETLTATWTINQYTVTFKDWDGTTLGTSTVDYSTVATAPTNPTRTGYTFTGWDVAFTNVTSDMTVTATYTMNDTTAPVITLIGSDTIYVVINTSYTDAGATALDNVDGDITSKIVTVNPVDISTLGAYVVTYNVSDAAGNVATQVTRTVNVVTATHKITIQDNPGGTIAVVAINGSDQTLDITPASDYHIVDVLVDGSSVGVVTSYTFYNIVADHTISATFEINPVLSSLEITTPATKLSYTVGDTLDISGLVVTGHYSDGSSAPVAITTSDVSDFNSSSPVTGQVLTITFGGKTVTYTVDIVAAPVLNPLTVDATGITSTDATLNGTNGPADADMESFWVSTSSFGTSSSDIPSGVYSTPTLPAVAANGTFSDSLSIISTQGIITGGASGNLAITPDTTYYFVAWARTGGTWYPGVVKTFTTAAAPAPTPVAITTATIAGVTAPVTNATPVASLTDNGQYTAAVAWSPSESPFNASTVYTATITLTPDSGYTLTGVTSNFFTVDGATATNGADSGVVTAVFPVTTI